MKFSQLCHYFDRIEKTSSRLSMTQILAELFAKLRVEEIDKVVYLIQGRVAPLFVKRDFGMADKMVVKAIAQAFDAQVKNVTKKVKELGDCGSAVEKMKKTQVSIYKRELPVTEVFTILERIAQAQGEGSQEVKISLLGDLFATLDPLSCRFLARIPTNTLRLGFSDMTVMDAFSWMIAQDKSLRGLIEKAYQVQPDLGLIGKFLKAKGINSLKYIKPRLFTPILMMKAERLSDPNKIMEKTENSCLVEPKFDGFRLQIHVKNSKVKLFSRNLDDVTFMYPDIVEGVAVQAKSGSMIFEGEAVGYNPATAEFLPFQETAQRKRKYGIEEKVKTIPLKLFAFDILYLDGKELLTIPLVRRRQLLNQSFRQSKDRADDIVTVSDSREALNSHDIETMFDMAVAAGLEGIVIKKKSGPYRPGARGWNWIKFKRSYSGRLQDTIDCLIMGYDKGQGKRAGFGIGAFLAGVYRKKDDVFLTIAKVGTGLSDKEWQELKRRCDGIQVSRQPALYRVNKLSAPDVWVTPKIVVEIRSDEITKSPVHSAGYALRFPRLERFRDDKNASDTTTLTEVVKLFDQQIVYTQ